MPLAAKQRLLKQKSHVEKNLLLEGAVELMFPITVSITKNALTVKEFGYKRQGIITEVQDDLRYIAPFVMKKAN